MSAENNREPLGSADVERILIPDVMPLDAQFGVYPLRDVPAALETAIFDGPAHTYVVVDGATLKGFQGVETTGLANTESLFDAEGAEASGVAAPFLVEVERGSRFLRELFTEGDAPWQRFGEATFVLLRSSAEFGEVRRHLRRFTKLLDDEGRWFYLRFYEPKLLTALLAGFAGDPARLSRWFDMLGDTRIDAWIAMDGQERTATIFHPRPGPVPISAPIRLAASYQRVLEEMQMQGLIARIHSALSDEIGLPNGTDPEREERMTRDAIAFAQRCGMRSERALAHVAGVAHLRGAPLTERDLQSIPWFTDPGIHPNARARHLFETLRSQARTA